MMLDIRNDQQERAWNGYEGRHWAVHRQRYDAVLRPGGRLAFVCLDDWRRGDLGAALAPLAALPEPSDDDTPTSDDDTQGGDGLPTRG
ncbi:hypothetical protein ACIA5A_22560 [Micromonospora sp. NPDC051300]|uniref:hypothetical protein n=1 Tax=Micromonospora sp. NPDC051300 TaxID=3364286 RepID=UPI0037BD1FF2